MKDFFRHNGILILIAAILLALVTAVVSMLFGGVADPLSNLVGILTTPVRNGITAVTNWAEEKYNDAFELEQMKEELAGLKQRNAELEAQARWEAPRSPTPYGLPHHTRLRLPCPWKAAQPEAHPAPH